MQRAIFLDRDGTLVQPRHYLSRPDDLVLYRGIGPNLRQLRQAGFRLAVITNQSGIARGYFTERELASMHAHLARELDRQGVILDAVYHCPHHPDGVIPELAVRCMCRKPEPGMLLRGASDLDLDLRQSWLVGDILDDVEAGNRTGCRTIGGPAMAELGELIPLTLPEVRRLVYRLVVRILAPPEAVLRWSRWRRLHQARAQRSHYRRRLAQQLLL